MPSKLTAVLLHLQFGQEFISLCRGTDVILDNHSAGIVLPEILYQTTTAADNVELHKVGVIFVLSELAEDALNVFNGNAADDHQIFLGNIKSAKAKNALDDRIIGNRAKAAHKLFADVQYTLMCTVFLGKHLFYYRAVIVDIHYVHRAVSDIADHIHAAKLAHLVSNCREALR